MVVMGVKRRYSSATDGERTASDLVGPELGNFLESLGGGPGETFAKIFDWGQHGVKCCPLSLLTDTTWTDDALTLTA